MRASSSEAIRASLSSSSSLVIFSEAALAGVTSYSELRIDETL